MKDLFETPELIPTNIKCILDTLDNNYSNTYWALDKILNQVEKLGYTFEYYLDAEPYGLRPIGVKLEELDGYN